MFIHYNFSDKDEQDIILARAQHLIAQMVGFKKWDDLIHASEPEQELAAILLRNIKNSMDIVEWEETLQLAELNKYGIEIILDYANCKLSF